MSALSEWTGARADYNAAFEEGVKACEDGLRASANPYDDWAGPLRAGWNDGFATIQVLRDGWEEENHQRARNYAEGAA